ncbi:glycoside hydrolase family protein [Oscillatoria sp. CS-180]|uniref:glycoside hydrolase family 24 protein n=1 Tax=Oscillatoria sp. CS-180 TaxID=3021720 RepID=UPI0023302D8B|nr:glycoside hydrolase family protein [Oscillatoria sp. CS-180]MDB9527274.1 glycoside hydrolase family protein [Oscillatoria sp. CS-180]
MSSLPSCDRPSEEQPKPVKTDHGPIIMTALMFLGVAWLISTEHPLIFGRSLHLHSSTSVTEPIPLEMEGGDPYVRALMRTISAAESNTNEPYHTLYGGDLINDLTQHPDHCIEIVAGPNLGDCTTAAGRYQFITTTWIEQAHHYHPQPPQWYSWWAEYSFEPIYQDTVVYRWLSDATFWGVDIPTLLRQDKLEDVLHLLSPTWTSLGYGIEDNAMTPYLGGIYQSMLEEELQNCRTANGGGC